MVSGKPGTSTENIHRIMLALENGTAKKTVILLCCDWYEPGYKAGGPVQSVIHLSRAIASDAEVYILTSDRDLNDHEAYKDIHVNEWRVRTNGVRVMYVSPDKQRYGWFRKMIQEIKPDVLHLNSMWSVPFTILPLLATSGIKNIKIVLSPRGMLNEGSFQFKRGKKKLGLFLLKQLGLLRGVIFHATDEGEKVEIEKKIPGADTIVIPNLAGSILAEPVFIEKTENLLKLIYAGRIAPQKNVHFILELLREIPDTFEILLCIAGLEDDQEYSLLCRNIADKLPAHITVCFLGALPNKIIREKLTENHFLIQTSYSENFGHSVFEALSIGRPAIISDGMPWKHLAEAHAGFDIPLTDRQAFLHAIVKASKMNQEEYDKYSRGALNYAVSVTNVLEIKQKYLCIFGA